MMDHRVKKRATIAMLVTACLLTQPSGIIGQTLPNITINGGKNGNKSAVSSVNYIKDPRFLKLIPRTRDAAGDLLAIGMTHMSDPIFDYYSTAFTISPCHILTARHSVFSPDDIDPHPRTRKVDFFYGKGNDDSYAGHVSAHPVAWGNIPVPHPRFGQDSGDWALLRLDRCVGLDIGYLSFGAPDDPTDLIGVTISMAGLLKGLNYKNGIFEDYDCKFSDVSDTSSPEGYLSLRDGCSGIPGSSGSPIFVSFAGHPVVIAINATESDPQRGKEVEPKASSSGPYVGGGLYIRLMKILGSGLEADYITSSTNQPWKPGALLAKWTEEERAHPPTRP